jgi:hypothetical protein
LFSIVFPWFPFIRLDLMFILTLGIILLGLLEAWIVMIFITICYLKIIVIVVN